MDLSVLTVSGKTLGENPERVKVLDREVIRLLKGSIHEEGGIEVLRGNLAPVVAVVKQSGVKRKMMVNEGPARVFHCVEDAGQCLMKGEVEKEDLIVLPYEGPKGGPGMRKMHMMTSVPVVLGLDEYCGFVIDGRFSRASRGSCIGRISPEAMEGGPIALVEDKDLNRVNIPRRDLTSEVGEEKLARRRKAFKLPRSKEAGVQGRYPPWAGSAAQGAVIGRISQT